MIVCWPLYFVKMDAGTSHRKLQHLVVNGGLGNLDARCILHRSTIGTSCTTIQRDNKSFRLERERRTVLKIRIKFNLVEVVNWDTEPDRLD